MLTLKEKFLMDTYGYVVVPNLIEPELVQRVRQGMDRMNQELPVSTKQDSIKIGKVRKFIEPNLTTFSPCISYDPVFLEIAMHPKILGYVQEIVGGPIRYEEQGASINWRNPVPEAVDIRSLGWHRGINPDFSRYSAAGANHYLWIKAIVFLNDIGPQDGGTSVIPGTHRFESGPNIANEIEPWMVHQVQGPVGSVLFFTESLVHSVTPILSDIIRYIIIMGYVPPFMREFSPIDAPNEEFLATLDDKQFTFMTGDVPNKGRYRYNFRMR